MNSTGQVGIITIPILLSDASMTDVLTTAPPHISAPQLGLVLHAEPLATKPPDIGGEPPPPPGVHRLQAARFKRSPKRASYMVDLIRSVLLQREPGWRESGFPAPNEMRNPDLQKKGWSILKQDPRTLGLSWMRVRKSFWRAVGRAQ